MTTQGSIYGEFHSNPNRDAVLLQLQGVDTEDLLGCREFSAFGANEPGFPAEQLAEQLYKGGSEQWFITYELGFDTDDDGNCPQVTRVYLSGDLCGWEIGTFTTRSGAPVLGVKIEYERTHERQRPHEEACEYAIAARRYAKIIELPAGATDVALRSALPDRYRHALHRF